VADYVAFPHLGVVLTSFCPLLCCIAAMQEAMEAAKEEQYARTPCSAFALMGRRGLEVELTRHLPGSSVIRAKKTSEEKPADAAKPAAATAATPAVASPQKSAAPVAASALYQRTRPHTILLTPNLI